MANQMYAHNLCGYVPTTPSGIGGSRHSTFFSQPESIVMDKQQQIETLTALLASINDSEIRALLIMLASASNLNAMITEEAHVKTSELNFLNKQISSLYNSAYISLSDERILRVLRSIFYSADLESTTLELVKAQILMFISLITRASLQTYQKAMLTELSKYINKFEDFLQLESYLSIFAFKMKKVHNAIDADLKKIITETYPTTLPEGMPDMEDLQE